MTRKSTRLILTLALAVLPLAPLSAAGGPPHGRPFAGDGPFFDDERMERRAEHQAERLTRALDLTSEQQVTLGRLQQELETTVQPLAAGMRTAHQQLRTLLDADSPDPAAVGTQAIAKSTSPAASASCGTMSPPDGMMSTLSKPSSSK